jgi:hypothetical protein
MDRKAKVLPNHTIAYPMFKNAIGKLLNILTKHLTTFPKFRESNYFFFLIQIHTIMNFLKPFPISLKLYFLLLPSFFHFWSEDCSSPGGVVLSSTPVANSISPPSFLCLPKFLKSNYPNALMLRLGPYNFSSKFFSNPSCTKSNATKL